MDSSSCTYNAATDETTITLPYPRVSGESLVVVSRANASEPSWTPGRTFTLVNYTSSGTTHYMTVKGKPFTDAGSGFWLGSKYKFQYTLSPQFVRTQAPYGGQVTESSGRLQILKMRLVYDQTLSFHTTVKAPGRTTSTYLMPLTDTLGMASLGDTTPRSGSLRFPVMARNEQATIDIINDSHFPSWFVSGEWEAIYSPSYRRI